MPQGEGTGHFWILFQIQFPYSKIDKPCMRSDGNSGGGEKLLPHVSSENRNIHNSSGHLLLKGLSDTLKRGWRLQQKHLTQE